MKHVITAEILRCPSNDRPCAVLKILKSLLLRRRDLPNFRAEFGANGNCHAVSRGLASDLIALRRHDGWKIARGICVNGLHSWLEYDGWIVEASNAGPGAGVDRDSFIVIIDPETYAGTLAPRDVRSFALSDYSEWLRYMSKRVSATSQLAF
jgi:hypothetical protein